jgi:hypothetical protein
VGRPQKWLILGLGAEGEFKLYTTRGMPLQTLPHPIALTHFAGMNLTMLAIPYTNVSSFSTWSEFRLFRLCRSSSSCSGQVWSG